MYTLNIFEAFIDIFFNGAKGFAGYRCIVIHYTTNANVL